MDRTVLKNLKELKKVEPDFEWSIKTKRYLLSQIKTAEISEATKFSDKLRIITLRLERKFIPSPVKMVAILMVFLMAGGTTLAAKAAIPGNPFYPIKTKIEKVELILVTSSKKEAKVHLKHAKNRIFEVEQLVKKDDSKKEENISKTVKSLQKDITAAQNSLEIAEKEKETSNNLVSVAIQLNQGTEEVLEVLNQTAQNVVSEETKQAVSEVAEVTDAVQDNATNLIVDKKEKGEVSDEVVTDDQVKEIVVKNITKIENQLKIVEEKVNQINQDQNAEQTIDPKNVEEISKKLGEAKLVLEEAKKLVEETSLSQVLEKVQESKEITKQTQKDIIKTEEEISKVQEEQQKPVENQQEIEIINPDNSTTSVVTSTALIQKPLIELGGVNNEQDPYLLEELNEEPAIEKTPTSIKE